MNKPIYLGMTMLDISKTLMYQFWYDYIKLKYQDRAKLSYSWVSNRQDSPLINYFVFFHPPQPYSALPVY